jgi:hypothetical protein
MALSRILHVLRRGPPRRRLQAWVGLLLLGAAAFWAIRVFWRYAVLLCLLAVGLVLLVRSLRGPPPSS